MSEFEDLLKRLGIDAAFGYGRDRDPLTVDGEMAQLVDALMTLDPRARRRLLSKITTRQAGFFNVFGESMASRAVQDNRPDFIQKGLSAISLAAPFVIDVRELLPTVSLLYRSCEKLKLDASAYLSRTPASGDEDFDGFIEQFPHQSAEDRDIRNMGYIEGVDDNKFEYKRIP